MHGLYDLVGIGRVKDSNGWRRKPRFDNFIYNAEKMFDFQCARLFVNVRKLICT